MPNSLCTNCKTYDYKCTYAPKVSGSIYLSLVAHSPPRNERWIQSEFLAAQDSHTGRAIFLYMPDQSIPYDALAPGTRLTSCLPTSPTDVHKGEGCWIPSSFYPS